MKLYSRVVVGLVFAALFSVCSAADTQETRPLYDRLGGKEALTAVVNHLWEVASQDERINHYFAHTKPEVFASQLVDFLCQGSGGPCTYQGQDMVKAHVGMNISGDDFDALAEDISITLDHFSVPAQEKSEVMSMLGGMKTDVINR
jgi:hemoglobin